MCPEPQHWSCLEAGITLSEKGPEEMIRYTDLGTRIYAIGQLLSEKLKTTLVPNENEPIMLLSYNRILFSYLKPFFSRTCNNTKNVYNIMSSLRGQNIKLHMYYVTNFVTLHMGTHHACMHTPMYMNKNTEWQVGGHGPKYSQCLCLSDKIMGDVSIFPLMMTNFSNFQNWAIIIESKTNVIKTIS